MLVTVEYSKAQSYLTAPDNQQDTLTGNQVTYATLTIQHLSPDIRLASTLNPPEFGTAKP